ncbi:MAG: hypothetical protein JWO38_511 [Gemmataceae bacterium]|nr:hypothetical protein [Gemmataceae bacterium]
MTPADVEALVRDDMRALYDPRVVAHVTSLLVAPPRPLLLAWPYGAVGESFDGFLVLDHTRSGTGIAYCRQGFGPADPWGLIFTNRESPPSTGMSDGWYSRFLDAYFESRAPADLDIWRVKEQRPGQGPTWVSAELAWDEAWKRVYALRESAPDCQYNCEHVVTY